MPNRDSTRDGRMAPPRLHGRAMLVGKPFDFVCLTLYFVLYFSTGLFTSSLRLHLSISLYLCAGLLSLSVVVPVAVAHARLCSCLIHRSVARCAGLSALHSLLFTEPNDVVHFRLSSPQRFVVGCWNFSSLAQLLLSKADYLIG